MTTREWATLWTVATLAVVSTHVNGQLPCPTNGCLHGNGGLRCQSCRPGCYGSNCSSSCHGSCHTDGCARDTGQCFRCRPGIFGEDCAKTCPQQCANSMIGGTVYCDRHTGACSEACTRGWTGTHCNERCPPNCKGQTCNKQTKQCMLGCETGWTGGYCNSTCDNCLMKRCNDNGYCLLGCKAGVFGQGCEKICPHCWTTGCDRQTGVCEQCQPGYHGRRCDKRCAETCYKGREGHRNCDRNTKACLEGCETGWHGSHCDTPCSTSCMFSRCYSHDGSCVDGCVAGYYGKHCHRRCIHVNCKTNTCDHNGHCTECEDGWFGGDCKHHCPALCESCLRDTGQCSRCSDGFHGPGCAERYQYPCSENCETCDQTGCTWCRDGHSLEDSKCTSRVPSTSGADSVKQTLHKMKHLFTVSLAFLICVCAMTWRI